MSGSRVHLGTSDEGAIGKVLLIIVAIVLLLGVAAVALWNPVIRPLVGEAVPVRVSQATPFEIPHDDPQMRVIVPADWTMQRALYNQQEAILKSPDLGTHVRIDTWKHGASPTLATALSEATSGWEELGEARQEFLATELVSMSVIGSEKAGSIEKLVVIVADATDPDLRAAAVFEVSTDREDIGEVLPAIAEMLALVEVPQ